jgi:hypothetical protein
MSSSYSWRTRMEKSRGTGNRILLGLRKVTAIRQLKVDHPLTVKATKPTIYPKTQRYNKEWLGQRKK